MRAIIRTPRCAASPPVSRPPGEREKCIEQLLEAVADLADRDDIHQAAERLARVQQWISREAERAAADPIFDALRLAS